MKIYTPASFVALSLLTIASLAAEPPAPTTAAVPAAAPAAPAASAPAAAAAAPVAQPANAPASASSADSAAIAKAARSLGYKSYQHDGKTVYCKKETKVGTNFQTTMCLTEDQVMAAVKRSEGNRDSVEALQRAFLAAAPDKFAMF